MTPATPFGHSVFCDDIRQEVGNKNTYVGAYHTTMLVRDDFPLILPKFCIAVSYYERWTDPDVPIELRVFLPGDEDDGASITEKLPIESLRESARQLERPADMDDPLIYMPYYFVFAPLHVRKPGAIKVRAYADGRETRLGALNVVHDPAIVDTAG